MSQTAGLTCPYKSIKHTDVGRADLLVAGSVTSLQDYASRGRWNTTLSLIRPVLTR